jgi:hypothetical protein
MRVRRLIREPKVMLTDTRWSTTDLPPKHSAIYPKTKPVRAGWEWRSAKARSLDPMEPSDYVLLAECNPRRGNWKAALIVQTDGGASVVGRFEFHGDHPGLHAHADCDRSGVETGPTSFGRLARFPGGGRFHRRNTFWTPVTFWDAARRFFRITEKQGSLI